MTFAALSCMLVLKKSFMFQEKKSTNLLLVILGLFFRTVQLLFHALLGLVYKGSGDVLPPIDNLILMDSATNLAQKIRNRKLTSVEVVQSFINRIQQVNKILNAVVDDRFESALEDARQADLFILNSGKTQQQLAEELPFLGVPFTVKDCISIKGLSFTGGLYARKDVVGEKDAECVANLRKAGAIPLGVTNVSELCLWWEAFNKNYGRTSNPYNTNHIVGGSSGGEGCILSAAGSPMGIGSDIGGSVRIPAYFNGIFGHKTSPGVGTLDGHHPIPEHEAQQEFLTAGPMSRFASDLAPILKAMAPKQAQMLQLDRKVDVTKLKYYYMEDDCGGRLVSPVEPEIKEAIRKIKMFLKRTHGIVAEEQHIPEMRHSMAMWFAKMKATGPSQLPRELANNKGSVNVYKELFKMLFGLSNHTFPVLTVAVLEQFQAAYGESNGHARLLEKCDNLKAKFLVSTGFRKTRTNLITIFFRICWATMEYLYTQRTRPQLHTI